MGQHDTTEEEGHDAGQVQRFADCIRQVREHEQDDNLLVWVLVQLRVPKQLRRQQMTMNAKNTVDYHVQRKRRGRAGRPR